MIKKIILINSSGRPSDLIDELFSALNREQFQTILFSSSQRQVLFFQEQGIKSVKIWPVKKITLPNLILAYLIFTPLLLAFFSYHKFKNQTPIIICQGLKEKLLSAWPAKILGLKTVWLEELNFDYDAAGALVKNLFFAKAKKTNIICFSDQTAEYLAKKQVPTNLVNLLRPGIKAGQFFHQENIFNKLARSNFAPRHKYFTLGTIADLSSRQNIESLLQATKICLSVIPNLQLIIIGEGKEKKNLLWIAKKMEVDSLAWFVGQPDNVQKWLDNLNLFIITSENPNLNDVAIVLRVMAIGLPIIGPSNRCMESYIKENKTGSLIEPGNSELLARQIIKLQQNPVWRSELGKKAKEEVKLSFSLEKNINALEKALINIQ